MSDQAGLPEHAYKLAVDTLYRCREDGLVMDQAAAQVALAIRKQRDEELLNEDAIERAAKAGYLARYPDQSWSLVDLRTKDLWRKRERLAIEAALEDSDA